MDERQMDTLNKGYLLEGETFCDMCARVAKQYASDEMHESRILQYMLDLWFLPATPILQNAGSEKELPISCYLNIMPDNIRSIRNTLFNENLITTVKGGASGTYYGEIRSVGESAGSNGRAGGVMSFIPMMNAVSLGISQGNKRSGSCAFYIPIWHPEVEECLQVRNPTGGDPTRKMPNMNHGIVIDDVFMNAVKNNSSYNLISPLTGEVRKTVMARRLWEEILTVRHQRGQPYILFIDNVNKTIPQAHKDAGLFIKTSNLCSEIVLPTTHDRSAVCCLSSLNMAKWFEWKDSTIVEDVLEFLDNVLTDYQRMVKGFSEEFYEDKMAFARYLKGIECGRDVGIGQMGFHDFLQDNNIPFESGLALSWSKNMAKHIYYKAMNHSKKLAITRGGCLDDPSVRNMYKIAIAPTASISTIASCSPSIEPHSSNMFIHKTRTGSATVKNKALIKLLDSIGKNTDEVWELILKNNGSVQDLDFLTKDQKDVFKTAFEINQEWVIEHAAVRQRYIDQAQSLNIFMQSDVSYKDLLRIHNTAWQKGIKSMYYLRSSVISTGNIEYKEECLACQ